MDPVTIAAVMGATQLIGGLLGAKSQSEMAKRQQLQQGLATQFGMEQQAAQQVLESQQGGLGNLVEAYRSALLGR
jgi:outer membrane lipoprotein SlyB